MVPPSLHPSVSYFRVMRHKREGARKEGECDALPHVQYIQGFTKEIFPDWVLTFLGSPNQPQAERKTQPPNYNKTWEGFFRDGLYSPTLLDFCVNSCFVIFIFHSDCRSKKISSVGENTLTAISVFLSVVFFFARQPPHSADTPHFPSFRIRPRPSVNLSGAASVHCTISGKRRRGRRERRRATRLIF